MNLDDVGAYGGVPDGAFLFQGKLRSLIGQSNISHIESGGCFDDIYVEFSFKSTT